MATHDYVLDNQSGANFRADLNNALQAIVSNNSSASEPATMYAYQIWVDTSNNLLKIRNSANNGWVTLPISITADNTVDINGGTVNGVTSFSFSSGQTVTTILDEDNLGSDSNTALATQQSIKAYVDSQVTAQDLDLTDGSSSISIDLDSESLGLLGGTGITSTASGNNVTLAIDGTVTTLTGTQTLTNKTIDADSNTVSNLEVDNLKSGVLDTDLSSVSGSDDTLASAKAIKTYVDTQITAEDLDVSDGSTAIAIDLDSETLSLLGGTGVSSTASGNGVTFAIGQSVGTSDDVVFNQVTAALVGNSSTATALQTARTINGTSFDGTSNISFDTDSVSEGSSNLYFTNARARAAISENSTQLSYNSSTGVMTFTQGDTDTVSEGSSNLYYTDARANSAIDARVTQSFVNALNVNAASVDDDSVALGTKTTGNYIATIAGTSNEIEVSGSGSETAAVTIGLPDNVTIAGNLTVNGSTTTVNTATLSVEDPLIKLANNNSGADSVDIGFYGLYDTSGSQDLYAGLFRDANDSGKFKLFKDLQAEPTTTVNVSGTGYSVGTLVANLEGNVTGNVTGNLTGDVTGNVTGNVTGSADTLTTARAIALSGDVVGTANFDGSAGITISTTIQANSIALGTDTTGNYIATIAGTSNEIEVSGSGSETAAVTIGLPSDTEITTSLGVGGGSTNGVVISQGAIAIKNGGTQSNIDFYCEVSNAHYARLQAPAHSAFSGNVTLTLPTSTGNLIGTGDSGTVTNTMLAGSIANSKLANSTVSFGGVSLALGASDATPAFDLSDATNYPTSSLSGTITNAQLAGSIANAKLANSTVSYGGVSLALGASDATPAFDLSDATNYPTSSLSGTITNAQLAGSIANSKLANSTITVSDGSNSTATSLGGTITFAGTSNEVEVAESSGTVTVGLPNDVTVSNDLTVSGNLTVTGTTTQTGSVVTDNNFTGLTNANTGNSTDFGFYGKYVESATTKYAGLFYDASTDNTFRLFVDTQTVPSTTVNTGATGYAAANLIVNTLTGNVTGNLTGNVTGNASGNAGTATALETARTINGVSFDGTGNITTLTAGTGVSVSGTAVSIGQAVATSDSPTFTNMTLSGTDSIKVPVGNTSQRNGSPVAGMFRYNSETGQFEGYSTEWGAIAGGGSGTNMDTNIFTGDGSDTTFTLSTAPSTENNLMVFIDGVFQAQNVYSVSGTTLTFATAPANGRVITVYHSTTTVGGSNNTLNTMTGDGSDTTLTLSTAPVHENNVSVYFDGVYQSKSNYSVSGTTLTFSTAPPTGVLVEAVTATNTDISTATQLSDADGDTKVQVEETADEDKIRFDTAGSERMIIDNSGNVGVGTTSPTANLHVSGSSAQKIDITDTSGASTRISTANSKSYVGSTTNHPLLFLTNDTERIRIDTSGNVGIGTSSPTQRLHVDGGSALIKSSYDASGTTNVYQYFATRASGNWRNSTIGNTGNALVFGTGGTGTTHTNATERMRIDSSGNVGIGITTPQAPLEVNQTNTECTHFGSTSTNSSNNFTGISLGYAETNSLNYRKVKIVSTGFGDGSARQNLDFLVDTNADSNSAALVDSKLTISGTTGVVSGDLNDTSDIGFKEDITNVTESLSLIKQLQPRFFTWKDSKATRGESIGFIAQEVEKVIPLLVQGNDLGSITIADDGSELQDMSGKSINTIGLVGYLTKAIQELSAKVEELEGKIE